MLLLLERHLPVIRPAQTIYCTKADVGTEAVVVHATAGHTRFCEQVGSELGCNGLPPLSLAVSPGIAKVGHNCGDGARGGSLAGINHDEQLHQGVIDWRAGWLDQEDITAAY